MSETSLDAWMASHPPAQRGVLAPHLAALRRLADAGYTHQEMRAWLAGQGVQVSRQAITKALASRSATGRHRTGVTPADRKQEEAKGTQPCISSKNRAGAPRPGLDVTLKDRALAVGEKYLNNTHTPLVTQMLTGKTHRKA